MFSNNTLLFNSHIGKQKMEYIVTQDTKCPFCDRNNLIDIIDEQDSIILVKNKYPVLQDAFQTVLIETDNCQEELSIYSKRHLYNLIAFGVDKWLEMENSNAYKSVLFFKNHGPYSGGTISHPHMQIIGLKYIDYRKNILPENFEGILINHRKSVELNLSTRPRIGFFEFNVNLGNLEHLNQMSDYIQITVHYILHYFNKACNSYNLFFYHIDNTIRVKIIPRFITSPLFVGYSIPQVSDRLDNVVQDIKKRYF